jgi:hypothetical protein
LANRESQSAILRRAASARASTVSSFHRALRRQMLCGHSPRALSRVIQQPL